MIICSEHKLECKLVPAGVSKTSGKPYPAFWACPEQGCRAEKVEADGETPAPRPGFQAFKGIVEKNQEEKVDWDAKDRQSMAQTAMKSASEIVAAQMNAGLLSADTDPIVAVKTTANEFYKELNNMKHDDLWF